MILYDFCTDCSVGEGQIKAKLKAAGFEDEVKVIMVKVPVRQPLTRAQFEDGRNYWPIHFFEYKDLESMVPRKKPDIWSDPLLAKHITWIRMAMKVARNAGAVAVVMRSCLLSEYAQVVHTDSTRL